MAKGLKELRDKTVFTFFIINALYVTTVFLLTLEKDKVFVRWPLGMTYTISYVYTETLSTSTVHFSLDSNAILSKILKNMNNHSIEIPFTLLALLLN